MFAKMQEGIQKDIDSRVYSAFAGAGTYLPTKFVENGTFVKDTMISLVDIVQTATGKTARIVGTKQSLVKLAGAIYNAWMSKEMKKEKHTTGRIKVWEGVTTIEFHKYLLVVHMTLKLILMFLQIKITTYLILWKLPNKNVGMKVCQRIIN